MGEAGKPNHQYELAVTFESVDLYRYAFRTDYTVGSDASQCLNGKYDAAMNFAASSYVYGENGRVSDMPSVVPSSKSKFGAYHFYMALSWREDCEPYNAECVHAYDLVKKPEDVCFVLRGGHFMGPAFRSNTVVVPKAAIEAALAASHVDFGKRYNPSLHVYE